MRIKPAGDQAVTIEFGDTIDEAVSARVIALERSLKDDPVAGIAETVPTYRSLLVFYDPAILNGRDLKAILGERAETAPATDDARARHFAVPVCYQGADALDLADVAAERNIDPEEVIALHTSATYRVYMIGFAPGFAYLGGLPSALHTPRLAEPRQKVPAGAVGIGGAQAAINSLAGPSGWRYIGRTPLRLFDPARADPAFFQAGDILRFFAVSPDEMTALERRAAAGDVIVEAQAPW
ncbi:5-oxoprolinase subunit PxpB [Martelella radicis]|uniref:KipI family sensor histidine kinase inhibitor n=1 Tax=Martelella radicis TaxID=1397476 RepID=A0A7W6KJ81_9HYPH|nr:KipI family sensor histidine kinase inhibitor [Martelella radicis]